MGRPKVFTEEEAKQRKSDRSKRRYYSKKKHILEMQKIRRMHKREEIASREAAYVKTEKGEEAQRRKAKAWQSRNPEKAKAHWAVKEAVRKGILIKSPCPCGEVKVHGHHDDYSKPLEVRWLCRKCHRAHHENCKAYGWKEEV